MADTFNPIVEEGNVPTDEKGLLGRRRVQTKDPEFERVPSTEIVIHRPFGVPSDEEAFVVLDPRRGTSGVRLDGSSRFFRIDMGERVIAWDFEVPSKDEADFTFEIKLLTVVAVIDPKQIAVLGVRDVRARLRTPVHQMAAECAAQYEISAGSTVATELQRRVAELAVDGIKVRTAYAIVEPDAGSAKRLKAEQETAHRHHLQKQAHEFQVMIDQRTKEHERALQKLTDEHTVLMQKKERDYELQLREFEGPCEKKLAQLKVEAEREKAELAAQLDARREELRVGLEEAERDAERRRQKFIQESEKWERDNAAERARHEAVLEGIRRDSESAAERDQAKRDSDRHDQELAEAERINKQIAENPSQMVGLMLAFGDSDPMKAAFKMLEDRQKVAWDRFKDLQKLKVLKDSTLRDLALALMRDPAGGAFGLEEKIAIVEDDDTESASKTDTAAADAADHRPVAVPARP